MRRFFSPQAGKGMEGKTELAGTDRLRVAVLVAALVSAVALLAGGAHTARAEASQRSFGPGEVLVKFEPGATGQEIAAAHRKSGGRVDEVIPDIGVRVVDVPVGTEQSAVAAYESNPNVSYAEVNELVRIAEVPNDPRVGEQWQYNNTGQTGGKDDADIDAFEAWGVTRGGGVAVAILDTGIDKDHVDLQGKVVMARNFTSRKKTKVDDVVGHGTHVAGSVAANTDNLTGVAGTCPECVLYNGRVIRSDGSGTAEMLARGITWAANNGADVISMSLGTPDPSATLRDAVNYAWAKGVVLAAAAGNDGVKKPFYPAYYPKVIAVGATDKNDARAVFSIGSSNYGDWVDIGAPGDDILSTKLNDGYVEKSGTSMATPHVAGVAGLVWSTSLCTTGDNACVRRQIETEADHIPGLDGSLTNGWTDGRRLNANCAVAPATQSCANRPY